jgi:hypothetical protein
MNAVILARNIGKDWTRNDTIFGKQISLKRD